jgi:hypothetical protein
MLARSETKVSFGDEREGKKTLYALVAARDGEIFVDSYSAVE